MHLYFQKRTYVAGQDPRCDRANRDIVGHDGQFDNSRLVINITQTCIKEEPAVLNHLVFFDLIKNPHGKIYGTIVKNVKANKIYRLHAKVVVNAMRILTDSMLIVEEDDSRNE